MPRRKLESTPEPVPAAPGTESRSNSIRQDGASVLISVRARPRAHGERIEPEREGAWPISVRAAPSEGAANEAVLKLLARALGRPARTCSVWRGQRGREETVRVESMDVQAARLKLEEFAGQG